MDSGSRDFLERFPEYERSLVANLFLRAVRAGAATQIAVLQALDEAITERLQMAQRYGDAASAAKMRRFQLATIEHWPEAEAYAQWAIWWEAQPREIRNRWKELRGDRKRQEWMTAQLPTDRQISYIRKLGWNGDAPQTRRAASELIDVLIKGGLR